MKLLVVRSEDGKIVESEVVEGDLAQVAKQVAGKAMKEWDPATSDFTVLRVAFDLRYKLPLNPDLFDMIRDLGLEMERDADGVIVYIPVYTIGFDSRWMNDAYLEKKMYVVTLYLDEEGRRQVEEYFAKSTKEPKRVDAGAGELVISEDAMKSLEEGLKELEEVEEKPKKSRGRRKRRSRTRRSSS